MYRHGVPVVCQNTLPFDDLRRRTSDSMSSKQQRLRRLLRRRHHNKENRTVSNIETPPVPALPAEAEVVHNETTNEEIEAQLADVRSGYGDAVQTHDGLDQLGITELRKLSRGVFTGGYDLKKTELIEQLRAHGVHV